jgi:hypothetical protein
MARAAHEQGDTLEAVANALSHKSAARPAAGRADWHRTLEVLKSSKLSLKAAFEPAP